ncbi:MAG: type I DNA topoisomerase [candidate division Zixibacteria bacterium]|nr:type I DNA topoisomerase [candidate division Zixibacteria bacterium]MDH3935733.1 type I DNA topoisomerase [candidate division Zixibacteria bacterium]MDH4033226.1 type I DNA topoisomerase [candidate division Zixibacteria bacterium]
MPKNLVIVESPAKTRTLSRFLGKDFEILATVGHVIDLPKSKIGIDVEDGFKPDYQVIKGKEKVIAALKKAAKKATTVYLAPDPDREGEAIAWHVANSIDQKNTKMVRVAFNEITESAVNEAIQNPREIDMNRVNAQQARRVLDRIVGYTVSPFLWKTVARNLSAGRVQSVALRLVCEREAEILAFKPQEYWQIAADLATDKKEQFTARLYQIDGKTVVRPTEKGAKKITIGSEKEVKGYLDELKEAKYQVAEIKKTERSRRPLPPFITSTLQQDAAKVYRMSPKATMSTAQKLYEGIEIGQDGPTGLITYMRTDSVRVSKEALSAVRSYIGKEFGKDYLPPKPIPYGKKKSAQDAHEAIRPTYLTLPPAKVKKALTPQQFKLYSLIWNRFVASQMNPAKFDVVTVDIEAGRFTFRVTTQKLVFDGFLKLYHETKEPDENGNGDKVDSLPDLSKGENLNLVELKPNQAFTKPPPRFSEAMLVKELEADGIGRPSTYASIISTLKDRKYVESQERKLTPTELGNTVNKILVENLPDIFNVAFTANMEKDLDQIEEGAEDWVTVMRTFYDPFMETIGHLKGKEKKIKESMVETTDEKCEKCGSPMVIKWGRNGRFMACSAYPECKTTKPLPGEEAQMETDEVCEKCGSPMVVKVGRFGRFLACSAYPDCKTTKAITLGIDCPRDGCKGQITEKRTRGKKIFYGCSKYPKCDFASWDPPVKKPCPECKHPFMVQKTSKKKGDFLRCPQCKHEVIEESKEPAETSA